jgi:hypothetical protein
MTRTVLGPPVLEWRDSDKDAHRATIWEARSALLILQQADFDIQSGREINFWLLPCTLTEFRPTSPLIDWLCHRSREAHKQQGFPPLVW